MTNFEQNVAGALPADARPTKSPVLTAFLVCTGLMLMVIIAGMALAIPTYDDTLLRILQIESPPRALYESHGDQPLSGLLWWKLSELGILWPVGIAANALGWFFMAYFTFRLYCYLSNNEIAPAIAASVLAIAPILTEIQFVVLSTGFLIVGSTPLVYVAVYLLFFQGPRIVKLSSVLAAILAFAGNLFYFYGVPAVAAGAALLCMRGILSRDRNVFRRDAGRAAILVAAGMIGFLVYVKTADFSWRTGPGGVAKVDSSQVVSSFGHVGPRLPLLLADGLWKCAGGAFFREVGQINFKGKPAMLGAAFGMALALTMVVLVRRTSNPGNENPGPKPGATGRPAVMNAALYCLPALTIAMLPVLLMGRPIRDEDMISRYTMTLVPFGACVTMALISAVARPRFVPWVAAFVVAISSARAVTEAYDLHRTCVQFREWGQEIEKFVDPDGYTLAVVFMDPSNSDDTADDVLNARLTEGWPVEKRRKFWATDSITSRGPHGTTALRGIKRPDVVDRFLMVEIRNEQLTIVELSPDEIKTLVDPTAATH